MLSQITQHSNIAAASVAARTTKPVQFCAAGAPEAVDTAMFKLLPHEPAEPSKLVPAEKGSTPLSKLAHTFLPNSRRFASFDHPSCLWLYLQSEVRVSSISPVGSDWVIWYFALEYDFPSSSYLLLHSSSPSLHLHSVTLQRPICRKLRLCFQVWKWNVTSLKVSLWLFPGATFCTKKVWPSLLHPKISHPSTCASTIFVHFFSSTFMAEFLQT